ncbi:hypothetical protein [Olleya sp. HaHaR_3_96]|uniref:hypothetical protein n=1 Tax=Olleya sp. HaHaR_3_96 TaxID=2745560 RepID=UPI001C4EDB56|nr:hypothetical protein [Olleya sp. HaHaR_3_96]QXP58450.1 hypothetical protein H0I26_11015 [Olleya sp. HaHaR_3_96]
MKNKKPKKINKTEKLKKLSRSKKAKRIILEQGYSGILNNQKWHNIFQIIENKNIIFKIKLLINSNANYCDFIRELSESSILINDYGKFIEFREIDYIEMNKHDDILAFLNNKKTEYFMDENIIKILGYKK